MQQRAIDNAKIEILYNTTIAQYIGDTRLSGLVLKDTTSGATREVHADGLFMAIGHEPLTQHLKDSGLEMDDQGYIKVREHIYTNIEGVFAAGDVHDRSAGEVEAWELAAECRVQQAVLTPNHVRHRAVDEDRPQREEHRHAGELHALCKRAGDECRRDDGEHQLVNHTSLQRDGRNICSIRH